MRIAFVVPNSTPFFGGLTAASSYPPLGILYLAAVAERAGHEVRVWDADVNNTPLKGLVGDVRLFDPQLVGISLTTPQVPAAFELTTALRQALSDVPIVVGGPHPSARAAEIFRDLPPVSYAMVGEGEAAFLQLLEYLSAQRGIESVGSLCYRTDGQVRLNDRVPLLDDLDALPLPAYHHVEPWIHKYPATFPSRGRPSLHLMATRGCPFNCGFCSNAVFGRTVRFRSPDSVLDELEFLDRHFGVREVFFQDDTANVRRSWFEDMCEGLMRRGFHRRMQFKIPFRVNERLLDLELLKLARQAGFWMIFYGVESGDQGILDRVGKDITLSEVRRAFRLTSDANLCSVAAIMVGNLGETRETAAKSLALLKEVMPDYPSFSIAYAYPGTRFLHEARAEGFVDTEDFSDPSSFVGGITRTHALSRTDIASLLHEVVDGIAAYRRTPEYLKRLYQSSLSGGREWAGQRVQRHALSPIWYDYCLVLPNELRSIPQLAEQLQTSVDFGEHIGLLGEGWQPRENWPPSLRHMGRRARLYLASPGWSRPLLRITAYSSLPQISEDNPHTLNVYVDGKLAGTHRFTRHGWEDVDIVLPDAGEMQFLNIVLRMNKTWSPAEQGQHDDARVLGIAVNRVELLKE